jgi:hypothetical protein
METPDVRLGRFAMFAVVIAFVVASALTVPLYALLDAWTAVPDLVRLLLVLAVWLVWFKISQAVISRLFERSETVRRATTPRGQA